MWTASSLSKILQTVGVVIVLSCETIQKQLRRRALRCTPTWLSNHTQEHLRHKVQFVWLVWARLWECSVGTDVLSRVWLLMHDPKHGYAFVSSCLCKYLLMRALQLTISHCHVPKLMDLQNANGRGTNLKKKRAPNTPQVQYKRWPCTVGLRSVWVQVSGWPGKVENRVVAQPEANGPSLSAPSDTTLRVKCALTLGHISAMPKHGWLTRSGLFD